MRTANRRAGQGQNARQQMCLDGSYDTAWATFVATRLERASAKSRNAHEKNGHDLVVAIMQEMSGAPPCSLRPKSRRAGDATWAGAVGEGGTINRSTTTHNEHTFASRHSLRACRPMQLREAGPTPVNARHHQQLEAKWRNAFTLAVGAKLCSTLAARRESLIASRSSASSSSISGGFSAELRTMVPWYTTHESVCMRAPPVPAEPDRTVYSAVP